MMRGREASHSVHASQPTWKSGDLISKESHAECWKYVSAVRWLGGSNERLSRAIKIILGLGLRITMELLPLRDASMQGRKSCRH